MDDLFAVEDNKPAKKATAKDTKKKATRGSGKKAR
jgi:hypothetical protein